MSNPYDYSIDPNGNDTANKVLRFVGNDQRVLELGTAAGVMTRELQRQGCRVTGVEIVPEMASVAEQWCERMIIANLDELDFTQAIGDEAFDCVVAADVLEHLREPHKILERLRTTNASRLVLSVPNVTYAGLVGALGQGEFEYREKGLLDRTHLRFFSRKSIEWLLLRAGWLPKRWEAQQVPVHRSEFFSDWLALDEAQRGYLLARPDAEVYQFIVEAVPAGDMQQIERTWVEVEAMRAELEAERRHSKEREALYERDLASLKEHQKAFSEALVLIDGLQKQVAEQEQRAARKEAQVKVLENWQAPSWTNVRDRRLLSVCARWLYRLAWRLGGR